jgi:hypothetical protein
MHDLNMTDPLTLQVRELAAAAMAHAPSAEDGGDATPLDDDAPDAFNVDAAVSRDNAAATQRDAAAAAAADGALHSDANALAPAGPEDAVSLHFDMGDDDGELDDGLLVAGIEGIGGARVCRRRWHRRRHAREPCLHLDDGAAEQPQ